MELKPQKIMEGSMAFMFGTCTLESRKLTFILESSLMLGVSEWALKQAHVQEMYSEHSWGNLKRHFPENYKKLNNLSDGSKTNGN
jgi:hypothetical protein